MSQVLRLANNLILWRLLPPEVFGLMALVTACMVGLNMFSDVGIGPSIIQSDHGDDPDYLNTAWTIQVGRETLICLTACLLASPLGLFYKEPQLAHLLPAVALSSLLSGFNSTRLFTAARTISVGRLTAIDLASQTASLTVTIAGSWYYHSIWAIVAGGAVANLSRLILSHTFLPGIRNRFHWNAPSARTMLRFGRWIFVSTVLTFLVGQSDRLIFGKLIPLAMLGVYSIATTWIAMSQMLASRVFSAVLFPLLSRLHAEKADLSENFVRIRKPWLLLCGCTAACLIAGGPTLIQLLYNAKAEAAGWMIQLLAGGVWLLSLENGNGCVLLAMGLPKWVAAGNATKLVAMAILIPLGLSLFGFPGAVAGIACSELARYSVSVIGTRRRKLLGFGQDLQLSALVIATAGVGLFVAHFIGPTVRARVGGPAKVGIFLEGLVIFVCTSSAWGFVFWRDRARRKQAVAVVPSAA